MNLGLLITLSLAIFFFLGFLAGFLMNEMYK